MTHYSHITGNDYSQIRESEWSHHSESLETRQLQEAADTHTSPPATAVSTSQLRAINRDAQTQGVSQSHNL